MDGRVDHVVAGMHLDDNGLILHAVTQVKMVKYQVQFCWQCFFCFQARLARSTEKYFGWHGSFPFNV
jgi:hypothetical protein